MLEEITLLIGNRTWEEVLLPKDANIVDLKYIFTIKVKLNRTARCFKARLVVRNFI
jgi:hypothetical protein